ncbi:MAG: MarR family transcriptional regulator [Bacteroidota bacterium]
MDVHQQTVVSIFLTYNWCNEKVKRAVLPFEITAQQYNVLRILRNQYPEPSTVTFLKSKMLDKMCDASRIVDRLLQKDLIRKESNSVDKRAVDVIISEKGLHLLGRMDDEVSFADLVASSLTKKEAEQLNELLSKLRS